MGFVCLANSAPLSASPRRANETGFARTPDVVSVWQARLCFPQVCVGQTKRALPAGHGLCLLGKARIRFPRVHVGQTKRALPARHGRLCRGRFLPEKARKDRRNALAFSGPPCYNNRCKCNDFGSCAAVSCVCGLLEKNRVNGLKRLAKYLRPFLPRMSLGFLVKVCGTVVELAIP